MNIFHVFAKKSLLANRARSVITIVGIILSTAMLTAVTTMTSSIRQYGVAYEKAAVGGWHVRADRIGQASYEEILSDLRVADSCTLLNVGYALIPGMESTYKPYFCIQAMNAAFESEMPIVLIEGRMPEKPGEVLIPEHVIIEKDVEETVGDTLTLSVGRRADDQGNVLWQTDEFRYTEYEDGTVTVSEHLEGEKKYDFTIVGIYKRPVFEQYMAAGYTVLTVGEPEAFAVSGQSVEVQTAGQSGDAETAGKSGEAQTVGQGVEPETAGKSGDEMQPSGDAAGEADDVPAGGETVSERCYDCYLVLNQVKDSLPLYHELDAEGISSGYNYQLLRFYGISEREDFNDVIYGMGSILIVIIVLGSIALIYNAFAISIGERTKQFGLLNSVGATRRQMLSAVCYEALLLCVIGIPLGIVSGICGIGITLSFFRGQLEYLIGSAVGVRMKIYVSTGAVALAALIGLATVLLSAWLPMQRALKVSAIDAIRQRKDVRLTKRALRIPRFVDRVFGLEGTIAWKNFKRNRKQYRATVISLAMSILMFVSVGSFSEYLFGSYRGAVEMSTYDISVNLHTENYADAVSLREQVEGIKGIARMDEVYYQTSQPIVNPEEVLMEEMAEWYSDSAGAAVNICFVPDAVFAELIAYYGFDAAKYEDAAQPRAIAFHKVRDWDEEGNPKTGTVLQDGCEVVRCAPADREEMMDETVPGPADESVSSEKEAMDETVPEPAEGEIRRVTEYHIGDLVGEDPPEPAEFSATCVRLPASDYRVRLVYPLSAADRVAQSLFEENEREEFRGFSGTVYYRAQEHARISGEIQAICEENPNSISYYDMAESEEQNRALYLMVNVFCYGFIILISLISATNIFHTISTNISLRRREFAMLSSVGMTPAGRRRMLRFECLIYGIKGLGCGYLFAAAVTVLMYYLGSGHSMAGFYVAWRYYLIAAVCVFAVVYTTMIYAGRRIRKENLIETLKDDGEG